MIDRHPQLPLAVGLRDDSTFESFLPEVNGEALSAVRGLGSGGNGLVYLFGEAGSGRTHLLEAATAARAAGGGVVFYLSLSQGERSAPEVLAGIGDFADLVCLDDLDAIAGDPAWEEAVFHLFNTLRARDGGLAVAAAAPPQAVNWVLADLRSRLSSGLVVRLDNPEDDQRLAILTFRAARRGLELPPEAGRYLLARVNRRLDELVALLDRLDRAALTHQRRLSIPFVRQVLQTRA